MSAQPNVTVCQVNDLVAYLQVGSSISSIGSSSGELSIGSSSGELSIMITSIPGGTNRFLLTDALSIPGPDLGRGVLSLRGVTGLACGRTIDLEGDHW